VVGGEAATMESKQLQMSSHSTWQIVYGSFFGHAQNSRVDHYKVHTELSYNSICDHILWNIVLSVRVQTELKLQSRYNCRLWNILIAVTVQTELKLQIYMIA
jgi:hypothetical protein